MPRVFDGQHFPRFLGDLRQLIRGARDHERRLTDLVGVLEFRAGTSLDADDVALPDVVARPTGLTRPNGLLAIIRDLCVAAREQRLLAERLAASLAVSVDVDSVASTQGQILVVDDSDDSRNLAAEVLELAGFQVTTAANGLDGVIVAHCALPDVILLDITMPVLDGIEAARLLKASPITRETKLLAYTAKPEFYDGPLKRLFVDVLAKPTNPEALTHRVQRIIDGGRTVRDSSP